MTVLTGAQGLFLKMLIARSHQNTGALPIPPTFAETLLLGAQPASLGAANAGIPQRKPTHWSNPDPHQRSHGR